MEEVEMTFGRSDVVIIKGLEKLGLLPANFPFNRD